MFRNYLKMAWKVLARRKFFTFISLFGIAFTLAAILVVVAIADHWLAASYPEVSMDRTLTLDRMQMFGDRSRWHSGPGYKLVDRYGRDIPGVERMSIFTAVSDVGTFQDNRKQSFELRRTDAEYWNILQFRFTEGTHFGDADHASRVAVISETTQRQLFGDQPAVGEAVELDGALYRIIGVVEDVPEHRLMGYADIWVPLGTHPQVDFFDRLMGGVEAAYLLEPDADRRQVQAAFRERLTRVEFDDPENFHTMAGYPMTKLENISNDWLSRNPGETQPSTLVIYVLLAILLFMMLPAINLVNINLSRIYERSSEIGVRKAFGASGRHLVMQFVVENVVLCVVGGIIGLAGAAVVLTVGPGISDLPQISLTLNWRIFGATFVVATIFGLLSGVWPAWKMSRQHPVVALRGGTS